MSDESRVECWRNEIRQCECEIRGLEARIESNHIKIQRLENMKARVWTEKENAGHSGSLEEQLCMELFGDLQWGGTYKNSIQNYTENEVENEFKAYYAGMERLYQSVCNEIRRLEEENEQLRRDIGGLHARISSLWDLINGCGD